MSESVFGYKIRKPYPGESTYFQKNPHVAGMAAEDGQITLNPFSKNTPEQQQIVAKNEAIRLYMTEMKANPSFEVTKEQKKAFAGTEYGKPENAKHLKHTIVARMLTGDASAGTPTKEQQAYADMVRKSLDEKEMSARSSFMAQYLLGANKQPTTPQK